MLSLMPLAAVLVFGAYGLSLLKMINAAMEAPIGYEDREGFHYGIRVDDVEGH